MHTIKSIYHYLLSFLGALIYGFPSRKIKVVGITGTKGKSTVISLVSFIFDNADYSNAFISSVFVKIGNKIERNRTGNTMPGRFFIQKFIRRAVNNGCGIVFIEVTSQGVLQHRHRFMNWDKAVFLDIHPEHIEAHGSFENYLSAKVSFFKYVVKTNKDAVFFINNKDKHANRFLSVINGCGVRFFSSSDVPDDASIPNCLDGDFNKINIACAFSLARNEDISDGVIEGATKDFSGLVGRMEIIQKNPFQIVVDYAHTPDSLDVVQKHLRRERALEDNKLICVFGSAGGGRDKWKRPKMGNVSASNCDVIILTDEDSYDENPLEIIRQIKSGIEDSNFDMKNMYEIVDRKEAIEKAISIAKDGDVVVCTGKGSEETMHKRNGLVASWNESKIIKEIIKKTGH